MLHKINIKQPERGKKRNVLSFTGAGDGSKNIFVEAGVQKGARPRRCHQSVGMERIISSILHDK